MAESTRPRRVPWGLVGMIVLVAAVEGFVARHEVSFRNPWGWDWFLADRAARRQVDDCEVLCFGDSLMKFGVAPRVIEQEVGHKSYNLAVAAGQAPGSYFLLRRALEAGARPKAVVIDAMPHLLASDLAPAAKIWPELLSPRDCWDLSVRARDPEFLAATLMAKLLPSLRDRSEIRDAVMAAFRGEPPPLRDGIGAYCRNWKANRGAQVMRRPPGPPTTSFDAWEAALFPDSWRPDPLNTHYLREFFRLAESRHIAVYWLLPPVGPDVQWRRDHKGRDAEYTRFVAVLRAEHPNVIVLDARHSGYGDDVHIDPIHLDVRGAAALSRDLSQVLRDAPRPLAGWVAMPYYRDPPPGGPLEDVDRSAVVARERALRR